MTETRPILEATSRRTYSQAEVISITKIFRKSAQHHEIRENTKYTYRVLSSLNLVYSVPHVHYDVRGSRYYMYIHAYALRSLYLACLANCLTNCLKICSEGGGGDESPYLITDSHSRRSGTGWPRITVEILYIRFAIIYVLRRLDFWTYVMMHSLWLYDYQCQEEKLIRMKRCLCMTSKREGQKIKNRKTFVVMPYDCMSVCRS